MIHQDATSLNARNRSGIAERVRDFLSRRGWFVAFTTFLLAMIWVAALPVDSGAQAVTATAIVVVMFALRELKVQGVARKAFLFLGAFISVRYLVWRTLNTIDPHDPVSLAGSVMLYLAELYGILVYLLGIFVNIRPLKREPAPLPDDPALYPSVDVFVPTYNESEDIIETTLMAAIQIDYPREKLRVHLCDDGGTDQKCNDKNPEKAAEARERRAHLQGLCERLGVQYWTRAKNEHAKAGNLNSTFHQTSGDLILILDTDHVPATDILTATVGWFIADPKMFLIQTPHFFINSDPIEKNLDTFHQMPSENEMFYSVIQQGLDFWNSAFFCGSAAVLKRSCLAEVGGIAGETITEDAETALSLHARGYRSAYIRRPLIAGLAPETMGGFTVQRIRWAQGMAQIFLLKNPLFIKGLSLWQRLCYFNSCFFWFFGYARLAFVVAPWLFLFFGLQIYRANLTEFLVFGVPHVVVSLVVSDFLFGRVRWLLVSEVYELVQCVYTFPALVKVFMKPRAPAFNVTPKGETLDENFSSPLGTPFYILTAITLASMAAGVWRYLEYPQQQHVVIITIGWSIFNLLLLVAAIGVLFERCQRRAWPRMPVDWAGELGLGDGRAVPCRIENLSVGGAGIEIDARHLRCFERGARVAMRALDGPEAHREVDFHAEVRMARPLGNGKAVIGLEYRHATQAETLAKVSLTFGDSERWVEFQDRRARAVGLRHGIGFLAMKGGGRALEHFRFGIRAGWNRLASAVVRGSRAVWRLYWPEAPLPRAGTAANFRHPHQAPPRAPAASTPAPIENCVIPPERPAHAAAAGARILSNANAPNGGNHDRL
ncbi:MAG: UDP-forming cellulose synthase catalytic subunit [Akkermansiaceae bacterium]|nr:UDP-forming cellulose synthase catalytic subunit [Akkermansiaceae bacterium]MCP5551672.1 UDP-forming cellulose synthase catalytic subunit [Akkermansiaceae bacterium]